MNKKTKFIFDKTKNVQHGNKTFFEHLHSTSKLIEQFFPEQQHLIDAGLFHAIYDTCYFKFDSDVDRESVKKLIGDRAEELVYLYCTLDNRIEKILEHKFDFDLQKELYILEYSNLLDQIIELDNNTFEQFKKIQKRLTTYYNINMSNDFYKDQLFVYDDKLTRAELNHLHRYCIQSKYKFEHTSDPLFPSRDLRFTCHLSARELEDSGVLPSVQKIVNDLNQTLYLYDFYINHYPQTSYVNRHIDAAFSGCLTIIIFCNKYWDETWGGELKIYEENSTIHKVVDFIPGRIVVFDSQIEHKVLPLTPFAQADRFTLAIKAFNDPQNVSKMDRDSMVEVRVAKIDNLN